MAREPKKVRITKRHAKTGKQTVEIITGQKGSIRQLRFVIDEDGNFKSELETALADPQLKRKD